MNPPPPATRIRSSGRPSGFNSGACIARSVGAPTARRSSSLGSGDLVLEERKGRVQDRLGMQALCVGERLARGGGVPEFQLDLRQQDAGPPVRRLALDRRLQVLLGAAE